LQYADTGTDAGADTDADGETISFCKKVSPFSLSFFKNGTSGEAGDKNFLGCPSVLE
jgi:hypothetical protein